ncbi:MAG: hypothetical protein ACMUJM_20615 [bacterium]
MKKYLIISFLIFIILFLFINATLALENSYLVDYQELCKEVMNLTKLSEESFDKEVIQKKVDEMLDTGILIAEIISTRYKECNLILELYIQESEGMKDKSLEEMKTLYHQGGIIQKKLKTINPTDDTYRECLEITQLITHPATVGVLLNLYIKEHNKDYLNKIEKELEILYKHLKSHEEH